MNILLNINDVLNNPNFYQLDVPIAITAPFITPERVIIGVYGNALGYSCIDVTVPEFETLKVFLYEPKDFRLAVHGIGRIWRDLNLGNADIKTNLLLDTEVIAHLLNSGGDRPDYTLSHLVHEYLQEDYPLWMQRLADVSYPEAMYEILAWDAYLIHKLAYVLNEELHQGDADLAFLYTFAELPIINILLEMSRNGICVDTNRAQVRLRQHQSRADALYQEIVGTERINLWSTQDVFKLLNIRPQFSNSNKHQELSDLNFFTKHPGVLKVKEWRDLQADLQFLRLAAQSAKIYPEWNTLTKTGRIYARSPAIQNVNKETCRSLLIPSAGCTFIKADYRQLQMRLLAQFSKDPALINAFNPGKDIHRLTAEMCGIRGKTPKESRDIAKEVNYGILFQMTAPGLAAKLNINVGTARNYIDTFWSKYPVAKAWLDTKVAHLKHKTSKKRYIESYLGRRRKFTGKITSRDIRSAKATILQQSEAEILRLALMRLVGEFRNNKMKSRVVMILHDAVWVEAPEKELSEATKILQESMTKAVEFNSVPLEIDLK